jgi:hypothetical protein
MAAGLLIASCKDKDRDNCLLVKKGIILEQGDHQELLKLQLVLNLGQLGVILAVALD